MRRRKRRRSSQPCARRNMDSSPIRYLPCPYHRVLERDIAGAPLREEWIAPGLVDIRAYPYLAPYTVPCPSTGEE